MTQDELNDYKHLRFDEVSILELLAKELDTTKKAYRVFNKHDNVYLGSIEWFKQWKQYVFYPQCNTVFHDGCMNKISSVLTQLTKEDTQK